MLSRTLCTKNISDDDAKWINRAALAFRARSRARDRPALVGPMCQTAARRGGAAQQVRYFAVTDLQRFGLGCLEAIGQLDGLQGCTAADE